MDDVGLLKARTDTTQLICNDQLKPQLKSTFSTANASSYRELACVVSFTEQFGDKQRMLSLANPTDRPKRQINFLAW